MPRLVPTFYAHLTRWLILNWILWLTIASLAAGMILFGPPLVPLWYSLVVPAEQVSESLWLLVIPATATLIALITTWQSRKTKLEHNEFLARISIWSGILIQTGLLVALARIAKVTL